MEIIQELINLEPEPVESENDPKLEDQLRNLYRNLFYPDWAWWMPEQNKA